MQMIKIMIILRFLLKNTMAMANATDPMAECPQAHRPRPQKPTGPMSLTAPGPLLWQIIFAITIKTKI